MNCAAARVPLSLKAVLFVDSVIGTGRRKTYDYRRIENLAGLFTTRRGSHAGDKN
jgi:hypothetical protein